MAKVMSTNNDDSGDHTTLVNAWIPGPAEYIYGERVCAYGMRDSEANTQTQATVESILSIAIHN